MSISAAQPEEWLAALELLQGPVDAATRATQALNALSLLTSGEIDAAGLLVARSDDEIVGAQLAVPMAGAAGLMWPPQLRHAPHPELEDRLVHAGLAFLRQRQVKVAHAIVADCHHAPALRRAGMTPMTHLLYLHHDLHLPAPEKDPDWRLLPFEPDRPGPFQKALLRTYDRTLDCPELNGTRTIEEILAGHQAQGSFRPDRWRLALADGKAIGVVMLNPLRDAPEWDLSYVGVVPEERRRGWGKSLILWALHAARAGGALELQVAVDERNQPALHVYRTLGFVQTGRRLVLWRRLAPS